MNSSSWNAGNRHVYWWNDHPQERYWVEIRHAPGTGTEIRCPTLDEAGRHNPWYDLVSAVREHDLIVHWHAREHRFVGWSRAAGTASVEGQMQVVPLQGFTPITTLVGLPDIRAAEPRLRLARDELAARNSDLPLYLPFQFRRDGLRFMSNYFTKLPVSFLEILFGVPQIEGMHARPGSDNSGMRGSKTRTQFLAPFKAKADTKYLATMPGGPTERTREHETLVNTFAEWLLRRGYEVGRNSAIDIGLLNPSVIIEAKIVHNSAHAIREAVSQLYEYRYFRVADPRAGLLVLLSSQVEPQWIEYLESDRRIGVIWQTDRDFEFSPLAKRLLAL